MIKLNLKTQWNMSESDKQSFIENLVKKRFFHGGTNIYSLNNIAKMYDKYTPSDLPIIFEKIKKNKYYQFVLSLGENHFGNQEIYVLSQYEMPNLIQTANNNIGDTGCRCLSEARWRNLRQLNLGKNQIGDKGCKYISRIKDLDMVELYQNQIGEKGCKYLSKVNWKIQYLVLSQNKIGDRGFQQFLKMHQIPYFTIDNCRITELTCRTIGKRGIQFQNLMCQKNQIGDMGFTFISGEQWNDSLYAVIYCDDKFAKSGFCCN